MSVTNGTPTPHSPAPTSALGPQFVPVEHEERVRSVWTSAKAFHADPARVLRGDAEPYCIVIPPPNVTDRLHLGHALNNTLQDILVRSHRMKGYETLWMPGTDHAGIATQAVVERRLQKEQNKRRTDYSREEFVKLVQAFKDEYEAIITNQLKMMGCSCDWDRQRFTMDEQCAAAVYEAFFRLFKDGLIYRGKRLVNWDPALQTAVADDECYDEELDGHFYYLRYPLVHASSQDAAIKTGGRENVDPVPVTWGELARRGYPDASSHDADQPAWLTVATTRPETYLADLAVALNPHDPRAKSLRGLHVELPLVGRIIPVLEDSYVVLPERYARNDEEKADPKAKMATGFLKVTPAHDQNDYEIGQRHGLGKVNMMSPDGRVSDKHGWDGHPIPHALIGKKMAEARKHVLEEFKHRGLLEGSKPHRHSVKHSDRSKAIIEPYLSDQWYVKVTDPRLAKAANDVLGRELAFHPERYTKAYEQWHDNIRDWCISRQLWWGHRVPVWSKQFASKQEAHAVSKVLSITASMPNTPCHVTVSEAAEGATVFVCIRDPQLVAAVEKFGLTQDADVLDTWFSSALWPMSTLGWPGDTDLLKAFNPTSTLCTAREIITLWVSRMVMFNRYFMGKGQGRGPVPFRNVVIHAVIQDGEGRKMSKSLGNGIDPLDIIATHGSDAMRFTLAHMTTQTQDVRLPVEKDSKSGRNTSKKFDIGRTVVNKLWNATAGIALPSMPKSGSVVPQAISPRTLGVAERWLLSRLEATVRRVNESLERFEYSEYATALYDFIYRDMCDWYIEACKATIKNNPSQQAVLCRSLNVVMRLAHPVMPYVTEVLWPHVSAMPVAPIEGITLGGSRKAGTLCTAAWPVVNASLRDETAEAEFDRLREFVGAIREVRAQHNVPPKRKIACHVPATIVDEIARSKGGWVESVAGLSVLTSSPLASGMTGVKARALGQDFMLADLADAVDLQAEDERKSKRKSEINKEIGIIETRISNPGYLQRAPAKLVEESRSKLQQLRDELAALGD